MGTEERAQGFSGKAGRSRKIIHIDMDAFYASVEQRITAQLIDALRTLDVIMSFPTLLLVLLIIVVTPPGLSKTALAVGILFVPPIARVTRSVTLDLMTREFIVAARARG